MNQEKLSEIIKKHGRWLRDEEDGNRANLSGANLSGANLSSANLSGADLLDADLSDADLWSTTGNRIEIKSLFVSEIYPITYTAEVMQIGCKNYPIKDWWGFDDKKIIEMDGKKALTFWREWKDTIRMIIEKSPATPTNRS